jgi:K+-sensing histidine kinase KdpD
MPMRKALLLSSAWIGLCILSTAADYVTGPHTDPFFLVIPVALAAWFSGRAWGMAMALSTALIRSWFHFFVWDEHFAIVISLANSLLALTVLAVVAEMTHRVASARRVQAKLLAEQNDLIRSLKEARESIKVLTGLLPICASCKKIRDSEGYWEQIEQYIRSHSEAEFSHGICPDCIKRLYPEFSGPS